MLDGGSEEYRKAKNSLLYEMWGNKAVSVLYEPGSTFKIVTTSVALEEKVSTVSEGFFCSGALKIDGYGTPIRCHKRQGHGALSFAEALQKSCNPTMIRLAERIGTQRFMSYFKSFGYTGKTGIDLPGEALGIFHSENGFGNVELSVYAFGQTFKTTPIQQISAVSAVANGGELLSPYVVKEICDASGATVYRGGGKVRGKVLSKSVCDTISGILCDGVNGDGGAKNAGVAGYRIAAKTGTSQKRDIKTENLYVGSCVAYSVNEEGSISVIIAVDEPQCAGYYGSTVAAPYVSEFLKGALPYLGVEPSYTADEEARLNVCAPSLVGMSVAEAKKEAALSGVSVTVIGSGDQVVSQMPKAQTLINREGGRVIVYTEGECSDYGKVPSVVGLTASEAIKALVNAGFNFRLCGATSETAQAYATVIAQDCAGAELKLGSSVSLWLRYDDKE
jgi:stage V sporulation protein D (sporulation-specific penicillin-binding protein)